MSAFKVTIRPRLTSEAAAAMSCVIENCNNGPTAMSLTVTGDGDSGLGQPQAGAPSASLSRAPLLAP